jgi:hypothetical protein
MSAENRSYLESLLSIHKKNLRELERQKALFGIQPPLHILNAIEHELAEFAAIERRLHSNTPLLQQPVASTIESATPSEGPPIHHIAAIVANPFGVVGRINDPASLFGRDQLLRYLFEELDKGSNRSLVGVSQIGKSSILAAICALGPRHLKLAPHNFIYLDMQIIHDENDFFEALCESLNVPVCRGFKLARALRGQRFILCLDEIEKMIKGRFTGDEREELRGLADGRDAPLKLVIASRSSLDRLFPDSDGMTSPLANICPQLDVPPFTPAVVRAFIAHRLRNTGIIFTSAEIEEIVVQSGGYPAQVQHTAAQIFERYRETVQDSPS